MPDPTFKIDSTTVLSKSGTTVSIDSGVTQKVHSFSAYVSSQVQMSSDNTWYEVSALGTWTERWDSGQYASGRFTPDQWGKIAVKLYKKYIANRITSPTKFRCTRF